MVSYSIYKITNLINGKVYIGQTTQKVAQRWIDHCCLKQYKHRSALREAIRKYGKESFKIETLNTVSSLEEANDLEISLISQYDCIAPKGYNLALGGRNYEHSESSKQKIKQYQISRMKSVIRLEDNKIYESVCEAAKDVQAIKSNLIKHLKGRPHYKTIKGYTFKYLENS
jgi:hypothetical protein